MESRIRVQWHMKNVLRNGDITVLRVPIQPHPKGETKKGMLRVNFDRSKMISDAGLLAYRELDEALGRTQTTEGVLEERR